MEEGPPIRGFRFTYQTTSVMYSRQLKYMKRQKKRLNNRSSMGRRDERERTFRGSGEKTSCCQNSGHIEVSEIGVEVT